MTLLTLLSLPVLSAPSNPSLLVSPAVSGSGKMTDAGDRQFIHQQEQQRALEQRLTPNAPEVRLSAPVSSFGRISFPQETPCFAISQVILSGTDSLPHWLPLQRIGNQAIGHCLGGKGINLLMSTLQNRLVGHGYITTRVLAPQQDLNSGKLKLVVIAGDVRQIKLTSDSGHYITLYSAFPVHAGNLLDLRDIEQGLENLQRLPTVQAGMEILPGSQPGESDIALLWQQQRMWRGGGSDGRGAGRERGVVSGVAGVFIKKNRTSLLQRTTHII